MPSNYFLKVFYGEDASSRVVMGEQRKNKSLKALSGEKRSFRDKKLSANLSPVICSYIEDILKIFSEEKVAGDFLQIGDWQSS